MTVVSWTTVAIEELANRANISLRTGCFCNPGAGEVAHHARRRRDGEVVRSRGTDVVPPTCGQGSSGNTAGSCAAIRISVGVATNFADVYRFMCFLQGFVDRTVDDIGRPSSVRRVPTGCDRCLTDRHGGQLVTAQSTARRRASSTARSCTPPS